MRFHAEMAELPEQQMHAPYVCGRRRLFLWWKTTLTRRAPAPCQRASLSIAFCMGAPASRPALRLCRGS